jgi:hypothetical protein
VAAFRALIESATQHVLRVELRCMTNELRQDAVTDQRPTTQVATIFEDHFRTLGGSDRYRDTLAFVEPRLKRLAAGLTPDQIATLFGAELTHINYPTFKVLCERMARLERLSIVETGSSAYGTNSSALFARIVARCGGSFTTIDINPQATANALQLFRALGCTERCTAICGDSVSTLRTLGQTFNVAYLDSYDLTPDYFVQSEQHGLAEFQTLLESRLLDAAESYILIDDTPRTIEIFASQVDDYYLHKAREHVVRYGRLPGKGALVAAAVRRSTGFEILSWEYQLLLRFSNP